MWKLALDSLEDGKVLYLWFCLRFFYHELDGLEGLGLEAVDMLMTDARTGGEVHPLAVLLALQGILQDAFTLGDIFLHNDAVHAGGLVELDGNLVALTGCLLKGMAILANNLLAEELHLMDIGVGDKSSAVYH